MGKKILTVNLGSMSKKYSFYTNNNRLFDLKIYRLDNKYFAYFFSNYKKENKEISIKEFYNSANYVFKILNNFGFEFVDAIGFRVVAPGKYFLNHKRIDNNYMKKLKYYSELAPLHIKPLIDEILKIRKLTNAKFFGISDSVFHSNIQGVARYYAINKNISDKLEVLRYGYHGIALQSVINQIKEKYKKLPDKIIVCHLGGGSSITCIKNGKSFDTSMGFTPLEGIFGSSRCGDIDLNAVNYLIKKLSIKQDYFNYETGFFGLTGFSDLRDVLDLNNKGNKNAIFALELYSYKIKKYIGSYYAAMNGLDFLVFSGAVGENSQFVRTLVCKNLEALGINPNKILVVKTDEEKEIIKEVNKLMNL
ncbi:hypothetical protein HYU23_02090 [Candidatus Woesearchaeota archaeon]|nr:hypothetical protein [Candidatus Woesearchaeota archaeon]